VTVNAHTNADPREIARLAERAVGRVLDAQHDDDHPQAPEEG
jgi:hypothetical protein